MKFRCPYCKAELGPVALAKCPRCGHAMLGAAKHATAAERKARKRKIEFIRSEAERQKQTIAGGVPRIPRGPRFYLVLLSLFAVLLFVALNYSTRPSLKDGRLTGTISNINLLAEALGRFRFHTGAFPTTEQGLEALTWTETGKVPGYNGPYLMNRLVPKDYWKHPYRYVGVAAGETNAVPTLVSAGPDGQFDTSDDILPHPDNFYVAGRDTSWTNEWVPYAQRGIKIVTKEQKAAILKAEAERQAATAAAAKKEEAK